MRKELVPDDYDRKSSSSSSSSRLQYTVSDGVPEPKQKKRGKNRGSKYGKYQMQDIRETEGAVGNHTSESISADKSPVHANHSVETDVREIRRYLLQLLQRVQQKEEKMKISLEWKIIALVLDRVFFFTYLSAIIISLSTIFPKTY